MMSEVSAAEFSKISGLKKNKLAVMFPSLNSGQGFMTEKQPWVSPTEHFPFIEELNPTINEIICFAETSIDVLWPPKIDKKSVGTGEKGRPK